MTWILIVVAGWMCLATVVGLVLGRVIRNRERQIPKNGEQPSTPQVPTQQQPGPEPRPSPRGH